MLLAAQLALTLALLVVACFFPGFFFVRKLRWTPLERLVASVGLSLILLYLFSGGIYLLTYTGRGDFQTIHHAPYWFGAALCVLAAVASRRDFLKLAAVPAVRKALLGLAALYAWALALLCAIRSYSGGGWGVDWLEHFHRTLFFLLSFPLDNPMLAGWHMTARPPLMNLVAAFFLGPTQDRYELFQVTFAFLNLLVFLPCFVLAPALTGLRGRRLWTFPLFFAANPVLMQNVTYTWTKLLAAFFVLTGLCFYLAAWRKRDGGRLAAAFLSFTAGCLTHYSAAVFAAFFLLHFVVFLMWSRPFAPRVLAGISLACLLLAATWFGWAMAAYGPSAPFTSHGQLAPTPGVQNNARRIAANVADTLVPYPLRTTPLESFDQPNRLGWLRDRLFLLYQQNLLFGLGLVAWVWAAWLLLRALVRNQHPARRWFWAAFLLFCGIAGIAVASERNEFGLAHLCLQSMILLGVAAVAASCRSLPRWARSILFAGCVLDLGLGVMLQTYIEHLENTPRQTIFAPVALGPARFLERAFPPGSLSTTAWGNWYQKHQYRICADAAERLAEWEMEGQGHFAPALPYYVSWRDMDGPLWHGWYARHGGSVTFLGDHFAR